MSAGTQKKTEPHRIACPTPIRSRILFARSAPMIAPQLPIANITPSSSGENCNVRTA